MNHLSETALEHYLLGSDDLDAATVEQHILECDDCAAHVRTQIELEMQLAEVASKATFCPGCGRVLIGDRCDACGATLVAGGYRIERVLVKTTHGRLYVAIDGSGNRVALKELAFVQAPTLESLAAFDRETKFLRALSHPCIPRFHASFIEGTGIHTRMYIAQDLVEGESLLARLTNHWFDEKEIVDIAYRVLDILIYLQSLSPMVFHRDIKPANLIVRDDGSNGRAAIALVDFGAARDVSETMGNTAVGTIGYMPMEQMAGVYDATTDLYALGASLLHLLTRREPWKLLDGGGMVGVNVSPALRAYIDRLCARRPQDRFPDALAARVALGNLRAPPPARKFGRASVIGVVALLGVGVGVGAVVAMQGPEKPDMPTPTVPVPDRVATHPVRPPIRPPDRPPILKPEIETKRPASLTVEDLIGPGLVERVQLGCAVYERLPSGRCPSNTRSDNLELPAGIMDRINALPADARPLLRSQIAGAQQRVADHKRGGIAIGKIVVKDLPNHIGDARLLTGERVEPHTTLYYAVAVVRPLELALHGYPRTRIDSMLAYGETRWLPDTVLEPLGRNGATITGTATEPMQIRAAIVYRDRMTTGGLLESSPSGRSFAEFVSGKFELPGFTPGRYHLTITTSTETEELEVELRAGERFDLNGKRKRPPTEGDAYVLVTSKPVARVAVDGVETGLTTPTTLKLSAGKHKIMFSYGTTRSSFGVRLTAGETLRMHKDLE